MAASERLYWNANKTKLVKEGDPAAAFLAAAVGDDVPGVKQAPQPANKSRRPAGNK